jgi:hypothetical protein
MAASPFDPVDIDDLLREATEHDKLEHDVGKARTGGLGTVLSSTWVLFFKLVKAVHQLHKRVEKLDPSMGSPSRIVTICSQCGGNREHSWVGFDFEKELSIYQCRTCKTYRRCDPAKLDFEGS